MVVHNPVLPLVLLMVAMVRGRRSQTGGAGQGRYVRKDQIAAAAAVTVAEVAGRRRRRRAGRCRCGSILPHWHGHVGN